ncbi:MAG: hypothetical protein IK000_06795 [Bacteroidaceae bacterium]|nr:hypothetical protein [Bacteroidaceae bacterium]
MKVYVDNLQLQRFKVIRILCDFLFVLFVFFFILLFQRDLIAMVQEAWSHGQTKNNALVTAIVISALLLVVKKLVSMVFRLRGMWEMVSFLPSFMLLSFATDVNIRTMSYSLGKWIWIGIATLGVVLFVAWLDSGARQKTKMPMANMLWPNFLIYALSAVLCVAFTNHNAAEHMELAAFRYANAGRYEKVARVGERSLETTPALTALRNVACVRNGDSGNKLFAYPQPYGANGLLVNRFINQTEAYGAPVFYKMTGTEAYGGETAMAYCSRLYKQNDNAFSRDLYIASLLLDRRIETFAREFPPQVLGDTLAPVHYREAWLLYYDLYPNTEYTYHDAELEPAFAEYKSIMNNRRLQPVANSNTRYLRFGKTYWHYYYKDGNL